MDKILRQSLNANALRAVFIDQLSILYNAKTSLIACIPNLVLQATFRDLKLALQEDLDDTNRQMIALKSIFNSMNESWLTNACLGMNNLMKEAYTQVNLDKARHFESDMSILFYMSVVENLQIGATEILNKIALKLDYQPYAQLVTECLDMVKENSGLLYSVTAEYLQ